jgi:O-antigen/teichoic acid export membrane protein
MRPIPLRRAFERAFSPARYLTLVNVLATGIGFAQGLITARQLGVAAYGVAAVIGSTNAAVLNFLDVRLTDLAAKLYYISFDNPEEQRAHRASVIQVALAGNALVSFGLAALGLIVSLVIVRRLTDASVNITWLVAQSLIAALNNWGSTFDNLIRLSARFYLLGTWRLATRIGQTIIFLVVFLPGSNLDAYYGALLAVAAAGLLSVIGLALWIWLRLQKLPVLRPALSRAWPDYWRERRFIFYGNLLGYVKMLHRSADVILVGYFADDRVTGLYKLARSLSDTLLIVFDAVNQVYYPHLMELLGRKAAPEYRRLARRLFVGSAAFTLAAVIGEALLLKPLLRIALTNQYAGAEGAIVILTVPFLFVTGIYTWLWPLFVRSGQLRYYTLLSVLAAAAQYAVSIGLFILFPTSPAAPAAGYLAHYLVLYPLLYWLAFRSHKTYLPTSAVA